MTPIYAVADEHDEVIPEFSVHVSPDERGIDITAELLSKAKDLSSGRGVVFQDVEGGGVTHRVNAEALDWCLKRLRDVVSSHVCLKRFGSPKDGEPEEEESGVPDDDVLMRIALAHARIDGAGVIVTPGREWVYAGLPVLARAGTDRVETSVELFGLRIPVRFDATEFVFDFHDGRVPTRSLTPGLPYPDMSIQGIYSQPDVMEHVTLTVTWKATIVHPVSGKTMVLDAALKTVEQSRELRVEKARVRLVAP